MHLIKPARCHWGHSHMPRSEHLQETHGTPRILCGWWGKTCKNPGFMQHVPFNLNQLESTLSCRCSPSCLPSQHSFSHFRGTNLVAFHQFLSSFLAHRWSNSSTFIKFHWFPAMFISHFPAFFNQAVSPMSLMSCHAACHPRTSFQVPHIGLGTGLQDGNAAIRSHHLCGNAALCKKQHGTGTGTDGRIGWFCFCLFTW